MIKNHFRLINFYFGTIDKYEPLNITIKVPLIFIILHFAIKLSSQN